MRITGDTTVQGNLDVPSGTTITVAIGVVLSVQGCAAISDGNLVVDASAQPTIVNGSIVEVIKFNGNSTCGGMVSGFANVTVIGATTSDPCKRVQGSNSVTSRTLSVIFEVVSVPNCDGAPSSAGTDSNITTTAIIAGSVVGAVVLVAIIAIVVIFVFRRKIVPAHSEEMRQRKSALVYLPDEEDK